MIHDTNFNGGMQHQSAVVPGVFLSYVITLRAKNWLQNVSITLGSENVFWEPNSKNCSDWIFVVSLCDKIIFVFRIKTTSYLQKIHVGYAKSCW